MKFFFCFYISLFFFFFSIAQPDNIGASKFTIDIQGSTLKIPYFSNFPVDEFRTDITYAVIVIHGNNRNADEYFTNMTLAAQMRSDQTNSTLIVAPQFLTEDDIDLFNLDNEHLYWSGGGWIVGSNSRDNAGNPRPERISSFAVLDSILHKIAVHFPSLESIVLTCHSAGGQVTHRYAATTPIVDMLCDQFGISSKFIVANPGSYLYLDGQRRIEGTLDMFEIPANACAAYNEWRYGLLDLFNYPENAGAVAIRNQYKERKIVYLLGENDNNPNSSSLDVSCSAMQQGDHRLERGTIYFNYLVHFYGDEIKEYHQLDTIANAGHDNLAMYSSDIALFHLFESSSNSCSISASDKDLKHASPEIHIFPNPTNGISIVSSEFPKLNFIIYDYLGRRVSAVNSTENDIYQIDISDLRPGIYYITFKMDNKYLTKRICKE